MLMRVQGDTLEEQRSDPTPEPLLATRESPLATSSKGSSSASSLQRETPSPHKSELIQRPVSRTKRRIFGGNDDVDRNNVNSPLQLQHSQSDSVPSLNLSSNSPIPSLSPMALSQEYDRPGSKQPDGRPSSRNSLSSIPQNDTGQYVPDLRNRNISPPLDKARVRHELEQWAVKGKGGENTMYHQPVNGKVSLPAKANSTSMITRYQPRSRSPPPALLRTDHQRPIDVNRRNSHSPSPPITSSPPNSAISYQSHLDSWVMQADSKGIPELPHSPPVRYQSETVSHMDFQGNRTRQPAYQGAQPAYQTTQGWKTQTQNVPQLTGAIPGRRYSQGRPQVADDRGLLLKGDRFLRRELEEVRAAEQHCYHRPSGAGVTIKNPVMPHHRQLPLSPSNSASSIISGPTIGQQRQQNQCMSVGGANVHETRV